MTALTDRNGITDDLRAFCGLEDTEPEAIATAGDGSIQFGTEPGKTLREKCNDFPLDGEREIERWNNEEWVSRPFVGGRIIIGRPSELSVQWPLCPNKGS